MIMKTISPQDLYALQQSGELVVIIDVRNPDEFAKLRIPEAILQPLPEFDTAKTLEYLAEHGWSNDEIYVTCASGKRAQSACQLFTEANYPHVTLVEGGTIGWYEAGLPVEGTAVE
jgi:rhodanese-related sulfurtransferase